MSEITLLRDMIVDASADLRQAVEGLPRETFERRPGPRLNPIGFLYFHLLRQWDFDVNVLCRNQEPDADGWHRLDMTTELAYEPLGLGRRGQGTGVGYTDDQVDAVPKIPGPLLRYHELLFEETMAYLEGVDEARLYRERTSPYSRENPYTAMRLLKILVTHTYTHVGDISYVKGMLGLPDITYAQAGQRIYEPVVERPQRV